MERRVILKLIAAGFLAPGVEAQESSYEPVFFTADEMATLERLTEILIPADDHSPGAAEARVNRFLDVMVSDGGATRQRIWRGGLQAVDAEAQHRFGKPFRACEAGEQEQVVATMAANELAPATELERFFRTLKRMTIDGYYTSKIGIHQELEYQGNTAVAEFEGCTHPKHQG